MMEPSKIEIRQDDFESFFQAPYEVYSEGVPFISQLKDELKGLLHPRRPSKSPMIRSGDLEITLWTAHSADGKILGRLCSHTHRLLEKQFEEKTGFFGYFDCVNQAEAARALHEAAHSWLAERGCKRVIGNFNLVATQMMGVLEEGFSRAPYVAMNYSGPQIPGLLRGLGYRSKFPMSTFEVDIQSLSDEELRSSVKDPDDLRWERASRRNLKNEMEEIRVVMNDAFAGNPYFTPLTQEEFWYQAKDLSFVLDPEITSLVYSKRTGELQGAVVTIPDVNSLLAKVASRPGFKLPLEILRFKFTRNRALSLFAAVRTNSHAGGLGWGVMAESMRQLKRRGYRKLGVTWVSDSNAASQAIVRKLGGRLYHRLSLYERSIEAQGTLP